MLVYNVILYYFGDWGLGIGDWAQSPIPNPQSPSIACYLIYLYLVNLFTYIHLIYLYLY